MTTSIELFEENIFLMLFNFLELAKRKISRQNITYVWSLKDVFKSTNELKKSLIDYSSVSCEDRVVT